MVAEGRIGRVVHVHARYAQDWPADRDFPMVWRFDKKLAGSGSLGDICAHSIDAAPIHHRLGDYRRRRPACDDDSQAAPSTPIRPTVPKGMSRSVTWPSSSAVSTMGRPVASKRPVWPWKEKIATASRSTAKKGSLYWDFEQQNYLYFYDKTSPVEHQGFCKINATHDSHPYGGGPWPQGHGIGYADTFVIEIANFVRSIVEETPYQPDFADGVACQRVLDAVERSANSRQWVAID